jgi:hypothetical protein
VTHLTPTSERWSLLGSAQKKYAAVTSGGERDELLRESAESYGRAANGTKVYPLINQVFVHWVRSGDVPAELRSQFEAIHATVLSAKDSADFWDRLGSPDYDLADQLLGGKLVVKQLEASYRSAAQQSGSDGDKRSVIEQLEFLAEMLNEKTDRAALMNDLRGLARRLRGAWRIEGGIF